MADKLKFNEVYHLSQDVPLKMDVSECQVAIAVGARLKYVGKEKRGKMTFSNFVLHDGTLKLSLPEDKVSTYIHDALNEAVRTAR